ncbi:alkaline phosphatase family protein [Nocardioides sp. zg-1228]|uniref:alkaline phosphatase family protein n=1 Tax=Nocardioides sp. zg-1228 TaxID=2763008 RepID=UPI001643019A|nr:alkaline phosphatase family protein [Nocardioides sp. zg-1228]MBC2933144.1 alkaline phosphatase family protein [Nocardioides sp. zg-1228]QSF56673.1 alkaline phosphatase family protein [Nocardioides sp. zg-1228]
MTLRSVLASLLACTALAVCPASAPAAVPDGELPPPTPRVSADDAIDSVVAISVDGLNTDALAKLGRERTPHLHDLMDSGASTLNARTERELTITLPNHTGMVTGRRVEASTGGHGVTWNDDRRRPATVQSAAGQRVESVFTQVKAAGGSTALFASKTKFSLWKRSWPRSIDTTRIQLDNTRLARSVRRDLRDHERAFRFVHLSLPDSAGHDHGFMSSRYLRAVEKVDGLLGVIVGAVRSDPELVGRTAIILTSDHGGLGASHSDPRRLANYRVPFMVAGPGVEAGADLYELNADDYLDPGMRRTTYRQSVQPVRNGDLANLALDLLDLGAVPGSEHNLRLDLDVSRPPA